MSLDVSLYTGGSDPCPTCGHREHAREEVFTKNITHNLGAMASAADLYKPLWRPEECDPPITMAHELVEPLTKGLVKLKGDPEHYRQFNPENGWGRYELLVEFVAAYLAACEEWPDATVSVSR